MNKQVMAGKAIECRSHQIIDRALRRFGYGGGDDEKVIVRRVVHATAEFSFSENLYIHSNAITRGVAALGAGSRLICDVRMLAAGCTHSPLPVQCALDVAGNAELATKKGITRSSAAFELLEDQLDGAIIAIGNAPTALRTVIALCTAPKGPSPALIIGMPVGFVDAKESKIALKTSGLVCITNTSRKGGSPAAAAVFNALCTLYKERSRV
ncbi:precorrin-8X methylmutase [Chitinispirillales bacterium ANBcel5]|uniref:precorrin-8X methylmutase n=1 Tax=Cellulosispirillum alkaliphilum TaxID=3039283 RepID=UPI002A58DBA7|nr:precorrin-8X methylmutase [Chitinispirillales bacterium ANBcel5]